MEVDGNEGSVVTLSDASSWTENYRNQMSGNDVKGHLFGKNRYTSIIDQTGCMGIRLYNGIDDAGKPVIIMVGVDVNGDDMENGIIVDRAVVCPPNCGSSSSLNS